MRRNETGREDTRQDVKRIRKTRKDKTNETGKQDKLRRNEKGKVDMRKQKREENK